MRTEKTGRSNQEVGRNILLTLSMILLFLFAFLRYTNNLATHTFHEDEQHFIRKTYYFDLFFVKRNFTDIRWYTLDSPAQPKFGPYLFGAALHLSGSKDIESALKDVDFDNYGWVAGLNHKKLDNPNKLFLPRLKYILIGRKTAVIFTLAAFLSLFLFLNRINPLLAFLATFLLVVNPLIYDFGKRAMTDSMQLFAFFSNLFLTYLFISSFHQRDKKRTSLLSLALGADAAFAVGVKTSGILVIIFLAAVILILLLNNLKNKNRLLLILKSSFLMLTAFIFIFLPLHPYLYSNPPKQFISMFTTRLTYSDEHRLFHTPSAIYSGENAIFFIIFRTILPDSAYANFRNPQVPFDAIFFLLGLWFLGKNASRMSKQKVFFSGELLVLLWTLVTIGGLLYYLKNDWPRYYLPSVAAIAIVEAYGISQICSATQELLNKKP